jgi:hypothetical protein
MKNIRRISTFQAKPLHLEFKYIIPYLFHLHDQNLFHLHYQNLSLLARLYFRLSLLDHHVLDFEIHL